MDKIKEINSIEDYRNNKDKIGIRYVHGMETDFYFKGCEVFYFYGRAGDVFIQPSGVVRQMIEKTKIASTSEMDLVVEKIYRELHLYGDYFEEGEFKIDAKTKGIDYIKSFKHDCNIKYGELTFAYKRDGRYMLELYSHSKTLTKEINKNAETLVDFDYISKGIEELDKMKEDDLNGLQGKVVLFDTGEIVYPTSELYYIFRPVKEYYKAIPNGYVNINNEKMLRKKDEVYLCSDCGFYHTRGLACELGYLDGYHSCTTPVFTPLGKRSRVKLGFEIEKHSMLSKAHIIQLKKNNWRAERDSSVEGGEYITPVLALHEVPRYFKKFDFIFDYEVNSSCGGHIHLSSTEVPETKKLYMQISPFRPLLWAIFPTRSRNDYCDKDASISSKRRDWHLRDDTIEFRIFPGVEKMEDIIFRTEILKFIYNNRVKKSNEYDNYELAKDVIKEKMQEIINIISIRYRKNTIPGITSRIKEYYNITNT